jgi:hypothetical protein
VVHCAGGSETIGPVTQIDSDAWRRTVDLNVNGTMYLLKHSAREMVRSGSGSFVGISSIAASNVHRWFGAYGVSKAALDHLMMLGADELGPSWVRVNGIRPGLIRTELVEVLLSSPEVSEDYRQCTPLPRTGEVEDVANLAMFLLSDAASWITGQVINVDGGHGLRRGPDLSGMLEPLFGADALRELHEELAAVQRLGEDRVGTGRPSFPYLILVDDEILAQDRYRHVLANLFEIVQVTLKEVLVGQHAQGSSACGLVSFGDSDRIEILADHPLGGARLLHLSDKPNLRIALQCTEKVAGHRSVG